MAKKGTHRAVTTGHGKRSNHTHAVHAPKKAKKPAHEKGVKRVGHHRTHISGSKG
jgi:hypothetical protein